jgi:hypothetical protein
LYDSYYLACVAKFKRSSCIFLLSFLCFNFLIYGSLIYLLLQHSMLSNITTCVNIFATLLNSTFISSQSMNKLFCRRHGRWKKGLNVKDMEGMEGNTC